jgi:hypothetical protein
MFVELPAVKPGPEISLKYIYKISLFGEVLHNEQAKM